MNSGHLVESLRNPTSSVSEDELAVAALVLVRHLFSRPRIASSESSVVAEPWLTLEAAAQHASVSEDTLREWISSGLLPAGRVKRVIRVRRSDIDDLLTGRNGHKAEEEAKTGADLRDEYSDTSRAILTGLLARPAGR